MTKLVVMGATLKCNKGSKSCSLTPCMVNSVVSGPGVVASMFDHQVGDNIVDFGECDVAPKKCKPVTPLPWSIVWTNALVGSAPLVTMESKLQCFKTGGAEITVTYAGQVAIDIENNVGDDSKSGEPTAPLGLVGEGNISTTRGALGSLALGAVDILEKGIVTTAKTAIATEERLAPEEAIVIGAPVLLPTAAAYVVGMASPASTTDYDVISRAKASKQTPKEKANRPPEWSRGEIAKGLQDGESPAEAADRIMDSKEGKGNYTKGPDSEHNKIQKAFRGKRNK